MSPKRRKRATSKKEAPAPASRLTDPAAFRSGVTLAISDRLCVSLAGGGEAVSSPSGDVSPFTPFARVEAMLLKPIDGADQGIQFEHVPLEGLGLPGWITGAFAGERYLSAGNADAVRVACLLLMCAIHEAEESEIFSSTMAACLRVNLTTLNSMLRGMSDDADASDAPPSTHSKAREVTLSPPPSDLPTMTPAEIRERARAV